MKFSRVNLQVIFSNNLENYSFESLEILIDNIIKSDLSLDNKKKFCRVFFLRCSEILETNNWIEFKFNGFIHSIGKSLSCGWDVALFPFGSKVDEYGNFFDEDELGGSCTGCALDAVLYLIDEEYIFSEARGAVNLVNKFKSNTRKTRCYGEFI